MANDESSPPRGSDALFNPPREDQAYETSATRALLENFISAAYQSGSDAQAEYERALAAIRKQPDQVVIEIASALGTCVARDYPTRWALVFAACELRTKAALPLLTNIANKPIPPEPQPPSHGFSMVGNETILRTTAVEGIGQLAKENNKEALAALFQLLRLPSFSLRRAAVQAILGVRKSSDHIEKVKACLPPEQHFLLQLKRLKVQDAPQVDNPQQFLSDAARRRSSAKPPLAPGHAENRRSGPSPAQH